MLQPNEFLQEFYVRDALGDTRHNRAKTIDFVFDYVDNLLLSSQFEHVDAILESLDVERVSTTLLLGFLTITVAAQRILDGYNRFGERVYECLLKREGDRTDDLIRGLI